MIRLGSSRGPQQIRMCTTSTICCTLVVAQRLVLFRPTYPPPSVDSQLGHRATYLLGRDLGPSGRRATYLLLHFQKHLDTSRTPRHSTKLEGCHTLRGHTSCNVVSRREVSCNIASCNIVEIVVLRAVAGACRVVTCRGLSWCIVKHRGKS